MTILDDPILILALVIIDDPPLLVTAGHHPILVNVCSRSRWRPFRPRCRSFSSLSSLMIVILRPGSRHCPRTRLRWLTISFLVPVSDVENEISWQ